MSALWFAAALGAMLSAVRIVGHSAFCLIAVCALMVVVNTNGFVGSFRGRLYLRDDWPRIPYHDPPWGQGR